MIVYFIFKNFIDVRGLMNKRHVQQGHEQVQQALHEYCMTIHPQIQVMSTND